MVDMEDDEDDLFLSERLIEFVAGYPELYDRSHGNHKNSAVRLAIWKTIGKELNISHVSAMRKWKALRDAYNRNLRRRRMAKKGLKVRKTPYKFSRQLSFLNKHLKERGYSLKADIADCTLLSDENDDDVDDDPLLTDSTLEEKSDNKMSYIIVHCTGDDNDLAGFPAEEPGKAAAQLTLKRPAESSSASSVAGKTPRRASVKDEDELWLLSLAPTLRRLSGYQKGLAKVKIQQLLLDIEYNSGNTE